MKKILFVNACVRPESRTMILARHLLSKLEGNVEELDLGDEDIKNLDLERLQERDRLAGAGDFSDDMFKYARQFRDADVMVMAAPYWDLSFPAMVKTYIEVISVNGLTFHYTEEGIPEGLGNVKKVIYVTTAGGPIGDSNFGFDYVDAVCRGLYSVNDVVCHKAEMLDVVGMDVDGILAETKAEIDRIYG